MRKSAHSPLPTALSASLSRLLPFLLVLVLAATLSACDFGEESRERSLELQQFTIAMEAKYRRESYRNDVDLHFTSNGTDTVTVVLTYKNMPDRGLAESIGDSAVDLVKRQLRQDPKFKDRVVEVRKEVSAR